MFAIISWGCAATRWVASTLDRHPDIACSHAANYTWNVLGGCERLDGVAYLRILGSQACGHLAAGDIHGVGREHVPELRSAFGDQFNAAVLVREPLARIRSHLALFEGSDRRELWDLRYLDEILQHRGIRLPSGSYADRFFAHSASLLNSILYEEQIGRVFRAEDVTANPAALGDLIHEITRGKVRPDAKWLREAVRRPPMNAHAAVRTPAKWEDWQVEVLRKIVDPEAWDLYRKLGYREFESVISRKSHAWRLPVFHAAASV